MADRTTKALLFAIALGLWLNLAGQWLSPIVHADTASDVSDIARDVHRIYSGICLNQKICG